MTFHSCNPKYADAVRYRAAFDTVHVMPAPVRKTDRTTCNALREVEGQLYGLNHVMCALKTQRNALLPISRLPPEVLSQIFQYIAVVEQSYPRTRYFPPFLGSSGTLGWIKITHVCRQWRDVALADSRLWAKTVCALPSATPEMLQRSGTAPITINHDFSYYRNKSRILKSVQLALTHIARTKEIRISANKRILTNIVDSLQDNPAPILETLELCLSADARTGFFYESVHLPARICSSTPRLRNLILDNCSIPWDSPLLRNLTHLEVRLLTFCMPEVLLPTIPQLITILSRCPDLQTLVLSDALPELATPPPIPRPSVPCISRTSRASPSPAKHTPA
ncbi:hypothetical protein EWM64_g10571 [Hericium alpestre]|uniref:F-box domain-containing protein n=1 Tax=Hericium alpestre TaxID=135208 RepID=A0A4Y9ZHZ8_9AGAM|nr:hypothetical protein EWM64_g10571 [Hericium alpestre]